MEPCQRNERDAILYGYYTIWKYAKKQHYKTISIIKIKWQKFSFVKKVQIKKKFRGMKANSKSQME